MILTNKKLIIITILILSSDRYDVAPQEGSKCFVYWRKKVIPQIRQTRMNLKCIICITHFFSNNFYVNNICADFPTENLQQKQKILHVYSIGSKSTHKNEDLPKGIAFIELVIKFESK